MDQPSHINSSDLRMENRLNDMEEKLDSLIENQQEFKEKVNKLYDALIGTPLTDNEGMVHTIKKFEVRLSKIEKFVDGLKSFWWIITVIAVILGFIIDIAWQYFINIAKLKH